MITLYTLEDADGDAIPDFEPTANFTLADAEACMHGARVVINTYMLVSALPVLTADYTTDDSDEEL